MKEDIKRYDFSIEYGDSYWDDHRIVREESLTGQWCMAYHIDELEDEILKLRMKYNDWEEME